MSEESKKTIIESIINNRGIFVLLILVLEAALMGIANIENEQIALVGLIGGFSLLGILIIVIAIIVFFRPGALESKENYFISFELPEDELIKLNIDASKMLVRDSKNKEKYNGIMDLTIPFGHWLVYLSNRDSYCPVKSTDTIDITLVENPDDEGKITIWETGPFKLNTLTREVKRK